MHSTLTPFLLFVESNAQTFQKHLLKEFFSSSKIFLKTFKKLWKNLFKIYVFYNISCNRGKFVFSLFSSVLRRLLEGFYRTYTDFVDNSYRFLYLRKNVRVAKINYYSLLWNFKSNNTFFSTLRLFSNNNSNNKNITSLSPGMFIKFFQNKKSYKKHKLTKLLIIKFFRKMFVIARLWKLSLVIKRLPSLFLELLKFFHQPVYLKFQKQRSYLKYEDYVYKKKITKSEFRPPFLLFYYFYETKPYSLTKFKKRGRIKRKVTRKLINSQRIID
jgi:hypothetical protein